MAKNQMKTPLPYNVLSSRGRQLVLSQNLVLCAGVCRALPAPLARRGSGRYRSQLGPNDKDNPKHSLFSSRCQSHDEG